METLVDIGLSDACAPVTDDPDESSTVETPPPTDALLIIELL